MKLIAAMVYSYKSVVQDGMWVYELTPTYSTWINPDQIASIETREADVPCFLVNTNNGRCFLLRGDTQLFADRISDKDWHDGVMGWTG